MPSTVVTAKKLSQTNINLDVHFVVRQLRVYLLSRAVTCRSKKCGDQGSQATKS